MTRNCFRCGQDFEALACATVCAACRKGINLDLSFRERQVIALVQRAKLNKEIAHELHITEGTVKVHMHHIFRKLGVGSRTELAIWAVKGEANAA